MPVPDREGVPSSVLLHLFGATHIHHTKFNMSAPRRRHEPCVVLRDHNIPCLVWFEDAIAPYGVPTVVFDLYLLVPDIDEAARVLTDKGWIDAGPLQSPYHFLTKSDISHHRLNPPGNPSSSRGPPGPTTTVLLPAADWNVPVDNLRPRSLDGFVPPLAVLLDALIDSLLDSAPSALRSHLAVQVSYLYGHCKTLKTQDFAEQLKLDHRQFHYDALSKPGLGTVPFIDEQRQIRAEIREGNRQPQRNAWYLPPPEKEEIPSASGWDPAAQHALDEVNRRRKSLVEQGVSNPNSVVSEKDQPNEDEQP